MKKCSYSFIAAIVAVVALVIANFLPGFGLSGSADPYGSASISCSVWGTSRIAACLNWIAAAAILVVLFVKADKLPILGAPNAKLIGLAAAAAVALVAFIIVILTNSVHVSIYGIDMSVSVSGEIMDMITKELPDGISFGHGVGCYVGLVGAICAGAAAVLDYLKK